MGTSEGFESNLPNTFQGDRGGAAEDADLLAELRAISNKSSSNRFAAGEDDEGNSVPIHVTQSAAVTKNESTSSHESNQSTAKTLRPKKGDGQSLPLPPWK